MIDGRVEVLAVDESLSVLGLSISLRVNWRSIPGGTGEACGR